MIIPNYILTDDKDFRKLNKYRRENLFRYGFGVELSRSQMKRFKKLLSEMDCKETLCADMAHWHQSEKVKLKKTRAHYTEVNRLIRLANNYEKKRHEIWDKIDTMRT